MFLNLKDMTLASFARPAEAAEDLFARNMDRKTALGFLALGVCLSTISNYITIPGYLSGTIELEIAISPIVFAVIIFIATLASAWGTYVSGRMFKGTGTLDQMIVLVAWIQWIQFVMQLAISVFMILMPPFAAILQFVLFFYSIWIFLNMVNQAHRLSSLFTAFGASFLGSLIGGVVVAIPIFFLLSAFGVSPV